MKKLFFILTALFSTLIFSSCASSKELAPGRDSRKINEIELRKAIEARKFIIRLDRLYTYGGFMDLRPRSNYIIVDGDNAVISAAYMGRQYGFRPVAGINMRGTASKYEITRKLSKGMYNVKMRVENGRAAFDVYLTIGKDGNANASVNSLRINNAQYRGYVVPLSEKPQVDIRKYEVI